MKIENFIMKYSIQLFMDVLDEVAVENELLEKKNNYYLQAYGEIDKNYKDKSEYSGLTVVRTSEKIHAKESSCS
jgi:hypothetical protein